MGFDSGFRVLFVCDCFVYYLGGVCSSVLPNFQGLEVGSYSHHRVVGGDQSLNTCNNRKKDCGEGGLYLVNSFSGVKLIG